MTDCEEEQKEKEEEEEEMNFDEVLRLIGGFGRFQKILYVWICLPQIFLAFHMLASIFTSAVPPHVCHSFSSSSGLQTPLNFTLEQVANSCFKGNQSGVEMAVGGDGALGSSSCPGGWEYSSEVFHNTIVTEVRSAREEKHATAKSKKRAPLFMARRQKEGAVGVSSKWLGGWEMLLLRNLL